MQVKLNKSKQLFLLQKVACMGRSQNGEGGGGIKYHHHPLFTLSPEILNHSNTAAKAFPTSLTTVSFDLAVVTM
jgi:hypothetical protein